LSNLAYRVYIPFLCVLPRYISQQICIFLPQCYFDRIQNFSVPNVTHNMFLSVHPVPSV
jgi:hypothetical protein